LTAYALRAIGMVLAFLYTLVALSSCPATVSNKETPVLATKEEVPLGHSAPVVVNILQPRGDIALQLQAAAELFLHSTGSGAQIRIQTVEGKEAYRTALRAKLVNGEQVDLFHLFGYQDLRELRDYAAPLTGLSWISKTEPDLLDPVTVDGKIYGVPLSVEGIGLIANEEIFDAAGIALSEIGSFEDLVAAFQDLRGKIDSGELLKEFPDLKAVGEFPAGDASFMEQMANIAFTDVFGSARKAADAPVMGLSHNDAFEEYVRSLARYTSSRKDWTSLNSVAQNLQVECGLAAGRVAVIQQNVAIAGRVHRLDEEISAKMVLLPIPLDGVEQSTVYVGVPSYWAVSARSDPEAAEVAKAFLTWLYRTEEGTGVLAEEFGAISPYRDTAQSTGYSLHSQLMSYIDSGRTRPLLHNEFPRDWCGDVFAPNLRAYLADELEWQPMLDDNYQSWARMRQKRSG